MKKIKYLFYSLFCFSLSLTNVFASGIEMNATSKTITKGTNITVTAKFTSSNSIFFTEGTLTCKGSGVNKSQSLKDDDMSDGKTVKSFSLSITPTEAGKVICSISSAKLTDSSSSSWIDVSANDLVITVNNPVQKPVVPKVKSSNNYLSSLTVEGYELDRAFDKETLEYNVTLEPFTKSISINAQTENDSATVKGTGTLEVNDIENKYEVVVTAEDGSKRSYVINATLKVLKELSVSIDNKKYSIVREENRIEPLTGYERKDISIFGEDVLAYYNDVTKLCLVVLSDEEGNLDYYIYDDGKYSKYMEVNFSGLRLCLLDSTNKNDFNEIEMEIGEEKIKAYTLSLKNKDNTTYAMDEEINNYYLVYAMSVNTGNKGYYLVDKKENTAISYDESLFLDILDDNDDNYKTYFFIALGCFGILLIVIACVLIINGKKKKNKFNF